ncbi:MAG TPA: DUF4136 domain-containing protein [Steroidobacteraceae bacterium]|nr:DUF4136 domain-containing protein [Steroidobacteraceae bacterium]
MTLLVLASMTALLAGCASGPKIRANTDPQANLSSYRTYGFVQPLGTDRAGYSTIVSEQLKAAVRRELEARGYTYAQDNPQLLVNFNAKLDDKLRVDSAPTASIAMGRGYYGYRGGFYSAWPAYETSVDQYTQGTLNIDVVDASQKRLVWEGIAVGRVTQKTRENLGAAIDATVAEIFKKFPITAQAAAT